MLKCLKHFFINGYFKYRNIGTLYSLFECYTCTHTFAMCALLTHPWMYLGRQSYSLLHIVEHVKIAVRLRSILMEEEVCFRMRTFDAGESWGEKGATTNVISQNWINWLNFSPKCRYFSVKKLWFTDRCFYLCRASLLNVVSLGLSKWLAKNIQTRSWKLCWLTFSTSNSLGLSHDENCIFYFLSCPGAILRPISPDEWNTKNVQENQELVSSWHFSIRGIKEGHSKICQF